MRDQQTFGNQDLVLRVSPSVDPARFDITRYEPFLDALCGTREYQKEAIRIVLRYLLGGRYPNLRVLAGVATPAAARCTPATPSSSISPPHPTPRNPTSAWGGGGIRGRVVPRARKVRWQYHLPHPLKEAGWRESYALRARANYTQGRARTAPEKRDSKWRQ